METKQPVVAETTKAMEVAASLIRGLHDLFRNNDSTNEKESQSKTKTNEVEVRVGSQTVYRGAEGKPPEVDKLSQNVKVVQVLEGALRQSEEQSGAKSEPIKTLKGSISIRYNDDVVYRAAGGSVSTNKIPEAVKSRGNGVSSAVSNWQKVLYGPQQPLSDLGLTTQAAPVLTSDPSNAKAFDAVNTPPASTITPQQTVTASAGSNAAQATVTSTVQTKPVLISVRESVVNDFARPELSEWLGKAANKIGALVGMSKLWERNEIRADVRQDLAADRQALAILQTARDLLATRGQATERNFEMRRSGYLLAEKDGTLMITSRDGREVLHSNGADLRYTINDRDREAFRTAAREVRKERDQAVVRSKQAER